MSQTVVVFQEDCILAAAGREGKYPVLTNVKRIELQGQGDSFDRWQQALVKLRMEWKPEQVRLVLPANLSSTRVLQLPASKGRQLAKMALKEVQDSFRNETADYSVIHMEKKGAVDICAGGIDGSNLDRFLEICQEAGTAVGGITVPMEGFLRVLQCQESYWNRTAIYLFFEEGNMTSILCQNGRYLYSSRSRLFSEPGTLDFGTEIVRSISGIIQFFTGSKREGQITEVYYAGCPEEDFEVSVEGIEGMNLQVLSMEIDRKISVPAGEDRADWIPCIGAMMHGSRKEKQIDLYRISLKQAEDEEKTQGLGKHFLLPAGTLLFCLLVWGGISVFNMKAGKEIESKQEWMVREDVRERYQQANLLKEQMREIESGIRQVEKMKQNLSGYPELSSSVVQRIEGVAGNANEILITGYDAETGVLNFDVSIEGADNGSDYALRLQNTGLFQTVEYKGYALEDNRYTLSISCVLAGNAAEGNETGGVQ